MAIRDEQCLGARQLRSTGLRTTLHRLNALSVLLSVMKRSHTDTRTHIPILPKTTLVQTCIWQAE